MGMAVKTEPTPVIIAKEQHPVPVILEPELLEDSMEKVIDKIPIKNLNRTVTKGEGTTLTPNTTEEGDRVTAGQRHISRIWEYSQALISIVVTGTTVYVLAKLAVGGEAVTSNQLISAMQLNVMTTLILTFYFARTNHVAIGGTGAKANEPPYQGR